MKIADIYNLSIKMGIESDFRGADGVQKLLDLKKKIFFLPLIAFQRNILRNMMEKISEKNTILKIENWLF